MSLTEILYALWPEIMKSADLQLSNILLSQSYLQKSIYLYIAYNQSISPTHLSL